MKSSDTGIKRIPLNGFTSGDLTTYREDAPAWIIVDGATTPDTTTVYAHIIDIALVQGSTTQYFIEVDADHLYSLDSGSRLVDR